MAKTQPVSFPRGNVVPKAWVRRVGRGRRDCLASRRREIERSWGARAIQGAASALGWHLAGMDAASAREALSCLLRSPCSRDDSFLSGLDSGLSRIYRNGPVKLLNHRSLRL